MNTPKNLQYTISDEWVSLEGDIATIGISDYAQHELGELVYVELPEVGAVLSAGDNLGVVESVKAVGELYSPVEGAVLEVNTATTDDPTIINNSPYEDGWLVKIRVTSTDLKELMDADAYAAYRA